MRDPVADDEHLKVHKLARDLLLLSRRMLLLLQVRFLPDLPRGLLKRSLY